MRASQLTTTSVIPEQKEEFALKITALEQSLSHPDIWQNYDKQIDFINSFETVVTQFVEKEDLEYALLLKLFSYFEIDTLKEFPKRRSLLFSIIDKYLLENAAEKMRIRKRKPSFQIYIMGMVIKKIELALMHYANNLSLSARLMLYDIPDLESFLSSITYPVAQQMLNVCRALANLLCRESEENKDIHKKVYLCLGNTEIPEVVRKSISFIYQTVCSKTTLADENNTLKMDQLALLLTPRK